MDKFTEVTTQWMDIDFTTAVLGETPYLTSDKTKAYPALAKYQINGIFGVKNIVLIYGSDDDEFVDIDEAIKNEQAYIFRSTDNGKSFEKICLGHGTVERLGGNPVFVNNTLYIQVEEGDTKKIRYYRSTDLGKTWIPNDWKPSFAWSDGTMFIENEDRTNITMSQDNGKTWHPLSGILKEFYTQTKMLSLFQRSLRQINDHTLVGMNEKKEFLFLDLKTMEIEKKVFQTPENKKIVGFTISNQQFGLELEEYTIPDQTEPPFDSGGIQTSYYFPETKEYVNLPKPLPYQINWNVQDNYIGGFMRYGSQSFGTDVHVYTLDRGKHWEYEILDKYSYMSTHKYINGQLWFVAAKGSAVNVFLTKGKIE